MAKRGNKEWWNQRGYRALNTDDLIFPIDVLKPMPRPGAEDGMKGFPRSDPKRNKLKGMVDGGTCEVTACGNKFAIFFHKDRLQYYCSNCAFEIHDFAFRVDKIKLFTNYPEDRERARNLERDYVHPMRNRN